MKLNIKDKFVIYLTQSDYEKEEDRYIEAFYFFDGDIEKYNELKAIFGKLYYGEVRRDGGDEHTALIMMKLDAITELEVIDFIRSKGTGVIQLPNKKRNPS